jgi:DNA-binding response OmpR family regulator
MAELIQPEVVLLDLALPVRSALDVLVRDQSDRPDAFQQKPIDLKELLGQVNPMVRRAHPKFRLLPPTAAPSEPVLTGE